MNNLSINANQIKELLYPTQKSMSSTYSLTKKYKERLQKHGFNSLDSRSLPRDWFFSQLQIDFGFSNNEIEDMKSQLISKTSLSGDEQ